MPVLDIEGRRVNVGDDFLKLTAEQQQATVEEIAGTLKPKGAQPTGVTDLVRSAATGVPILGALANKLNAATNAVLAPAIEPFLEKGPDTLDQPTLGERYSKSLEIQNKRDATFAKEHPIADTVAKITGGVAGTIPAVLAAPKLFGVTGTLPQQVGRGAASGAGLSGADAALRGEDVGTAVAIGGGLGAAAPLVAKGIGKVIEKVRPSGPAVPQIVEDVAGTKVPLRPDQVSGDFAGAQEAEAVLKGGRGDAAQRVGQGFADDQAAALREAEGKIAAGLDPTGAAARTGPHEAAEAVLDETIAREATRLATERAGLERTALEGDRLRAGLATSTDAAGNPVVMGSPAAAAEAVGAGVEARRNAATARTRERYDAVRDEPGTFDPEMVAGMSGDVRARLGTGERPEFVDPETAKRSTQALGIMDNMGGLGLFNNRVPGNVGPVAEAGARAGRGQADEAVAQLVAQGVNPERARAAVAREFGEQPAGRGIFDAHDVATADGKSVRVVPKVVEASSLKTSADQGYDSALQPRDRARAASSLQVNDIARNLNPNRLGLSSEADRGAPIVGADRMVESGNGRVLAIRQAYQEGGESAARYRDWLKSQGVDVGAYREPVLVRERSTPMTPAERKAFTVSANQAATLSMSAAERALADSRALNPEVLGLIRNPADLGAADNRDFVRAFMNSVPASERGALVTANGELSSEGLTRVRNAVLGKAYGDTPVLARIAESASDDVKSISNGLVSAAPEWAQMRSRIAAGDVPASLDVTGDLVDAVSRTARIRGRGQGLAEANAQGDAFTQQSEASKALQRLFYDADGAKAAPASQVGAALRHYAQEASKVDAAPGLRLGLAPVTADDILRVTAQKAGAPKELAKEVAEAALEKSAPAATGPQITDVGLKEMDAARKRIVSLYSDARRDFQNPNDARILGRILHEFDNSIIQAFEGGRFSGDSARAAQLLTDARASHAEYRQTFTSRGGQDPIGRDVEKILGRYSDTRATPDEIAKMSYGSVADPGGGRAARVAQRLRTILGESSPEWGAYKQGLLSHLIDTPPGSALRSASATADRIERFLDGTQGKVLADVALSRGERDQLRSYAQSLRSSEPVALGDLKGVDKIMARISGRDGGRPATPQDVVDLLFSRSGKANKSESVLVAQQLKRDLSPEGWTAVRQGMWDKIINAGEGKVPFEAQALSQRLHEFLHGSGKDMANTLFTAAERAEMAKLATVYKQMIPVKGSTNPSGTAAMLNRMASRTGSSIIGMLGGVHSGFLGAAAAYGGAKAAGAVRDAARARSAVPIFFGEQPRAAVRSSRVPIVLSQAVAPQLSQ